MSNKLYAVRDIMDNRLSEIYCIHVQAMTKEGLHSKSDIAAELAWRDLQLNDFADKAEQLERERNELAAKVERFRSAAFNILVDRTGTDEWYDLEKAYRETPSTALAALKAQWQAEAMDNLAEKLKWGIVVDHIKEEATLIRQRTQE